MVEQLDLFMESAKVSEQDLQEKHDSKNKVRKLTPREWQVYRLIKYNSLVEHRKTTQREIYEKVSGFTWNDSPLAHDHCTAIWTDIKNNNESFEHDKIIISDNFEYWVGSEQETNEYLDKLWNDLCPRLMRYWKYLNKTKQNGQGRLFDKYGNPIDYDSDNVRAFVESFNND